GKPFARLAWKEFSEAFEEYPYGSGLYTAPTQIGPANPFYEKPTGYAPTMVGMPYDGVNNWCGPYTPEIYASQMEKIANGWKKGITQLEKALPFVPKERKADVTLDLRCAKAGALTFGSVARQCRFILLRDEFGAIPESEKQSEKANIIRKKIRTLIEEEITDSIELFKISRDDSRIGFEASNHYFYVPFDLVEKVINCRAILEKY
ncbi:MAG: hypothetical protein ACRC2T_01485, partial [Thermoguttaceae bacterium]